VSWVLLKPSQRKLRSSSACTKAPTTTPTTVTTPMVSSLEVSL